MTETDIEESDTPAKQVTPQKRMLEEEPELGLADFDPVSSDGQGVRRRQRRV